MLPQPPKFNVYNNILFACIFVNQMYDPLESHLALPWAWEDHYWPGLGEKRILT